MNQNEETARIALLEHYSSRSANEGIIILTMVLAFLTLLQALPFAGWKWLYVLFLFPGILYGIVRGIQRFLVWTKLADSISVIKIVELNTAEGAIKEARKKQYTIKTLKMANMLAKKEDVTLVVDIDQSLLWRLHVPCGFYSAGCRRTGRFKWFFIFMEAHYKYKLIPYLVYVGIASILLFSEAL